MSLWGPTGRRVPTWSTLGAAVSSALSIAGLDGSSAIVSVGPPLLARALSFGSTLFELVPARCGVVSELRLLPESVIVPYALVPGALVARMVFLRIKVPAAR